MPTSCSDDKRVSVGDAIYRMMPVPKGARFKYNGCEICQNEGHCSELKKQAPEDELYYCADIVWIKDTPEGYAEYVAALMEAT
jgi:hypothetical protein